MSLSKRVILGGEIARKFMMLILGGKNMTTITAGPLRVQMHPVLLVG